MGVGSNAQAADMRDFRGGTFLNRYGFAGRDGKIERRNRSRHVEWHAIFPGENGDLIRADLVGRIAIRGDAVRADHDRANVSRS